MAQFQKISLIILIVAIVAIAAEPPRYRKRFAARKLQPLRQRPAVQQKRVFARQEAVTPYPTADELKPEVPFEEGNQPDEVYGPPNETYGPPELDQTPTDQLPSEEAPELFAPNPDAEEFQPAIVDGPAVAPVEGGLISRFINRKKFNKKRIASRLVQKKKTQKSQRLAVPVALPYTIKSKRYFLLNQPLTYTAHYRTW